MLALNHFSGLLLWIHLLTFVQCDTSCTLEKFKQSNLFDENFSLSNLKASYNSGDNVRVHCKVGFRGFFKLICSDGQWFNTGDKCRPISCGHPGDVQFADFRLVQGSDYVFGSQVQYTCHRGYQMSSFTSTRDCLQGGWSGHLPECEPVSCQSFVVDDRVLVYGDLDHPTSGSVLQFSCRSRDDELEGPTQIECDDTGNWSSRPPICKEITCTKPTLDNFQVEEEKIVYKIDEVLRYNCNYGYKKLDGRLPVCRKVGQSGQWEPTPRCEVKTCKVKARPTAGTIYNPANQLSFTVGQSVTVSCRDNQWVKSRDLQSAQLTCQETEKWDFEADCQPVTCTKSDEHVYSWQNRYYAANMGESVWYRCHGGYEETARGATCTRQGWEPSLLCKEMRCNKPLYGNAEITDYYKKDKYEHNDRVHLRCFYNEPEVTFYVDCSYGEWSGSVRCREKPCTTQPHVENGDMQDVAKAEYEHGESVRFECKNETGVFRVTCQSGEWKTEKTCADHTSCGSPPSLENGDFFGSGNEFAHNAQVLYQCQEKYVMQGGPHKTCVDGVWTGEITCLNPRSCGSPPSLENGDFFGSGYEFAHNAQVLYQCQEKYIMQGGPHKTCLNGVWTGEITCLKPCTVNPDLMVPNKIKFRHGDSNKLYAPHLDHLTFECVDGATHDGQTEMRQQCHDGVMALPRCV